MHECEAATRSGFNEFISQQKKHGGVTDVTLTKFSTECYPVFSGLKLKDVPKLTEKNYAPHGMTALHDAVGKTVEELQKTTPAGERVLCCIITDGEENSSKEYSLKQVKALIEKMQSTGCWTFVFMGANQDAWAVGHKMGMPITNAINYTHSDSGTRAAYNVLATSVKCFASSRSMSSDSYFGGSKTVDGLANAGLSGRK